MGIVLLFIALSRIIYLDIALGILLGVIVIFINIGLQTIFMKAIPDTFSGKFFKILNAGSETTTAQIPAAAIIYGK